MQFINKTGLVLIGAAFLSAPVFVGCDDDKDGTDLTGGSGGTAGNAGSSGSSGSSGVAGSSGAGGDGGDSGSGGTGGSGGTSADPDAGDAGLADPLPWCEAICEAQAEFAGAGDSDAGTDAGASDAGASCGLIPDCATALCEGFGRQCPAEENGYFECMSTQPSSVYQCQDGVVGTPFANPEVGGTGTEHGCVAQERALLCCLGAIPEDDCD